MISALERLRELRAGHWVAGSATLEPDRTAPGTTGQPEQHSYVAPDDLPPDWRIEWEERAAIREYEGGQAREHAEAEALQEIVERMRAAGILENRLDTISGV